MNKVLESLLARQAFKESRFNPKAVSPVGAKGLAQFMPETWKQFQQAFGDYTLDAFNSEHSIKAQKWYMDWLDQYIAKKDSSLSEEERAPWVLAAYNWGPGNVNKLFNALQNEGKDTTNISSWITRIPKETEDYIKTVYYKQDPQFERNFEQAINSGVMKAYYNESPSNSRSFTGTIFSEATRQKWALLEEAKKKVLETNSKPVVGKSEFKQAFPINYLDIMKNNMYTDILLKNDPLINSLKEEEKIEEVPELFTSVFDNLKDLPITRTNLSSKFVIPSFAKKFGGTLK